MFLNAFTILSNLGADRRIRGAINRTKTYVLKIGNKLLKVGLEFGKHHMIGDDMLAKLEILIDCIKLEVI